MLDELIANSFAHSSPRWHRCDRPFAEDDLVDVAQRNMKLVRERGLAECEQLLQRISPGVGFGITSASVIVDDLDIGRRSFPPGKTDLPLVVVIYVPVYQNMC